jgi:hypothetical protein
MGIFPLASYTPSALCSLRLYSTKFNNQPQPIVVLKPNHSRIGEFSIFCLKPGLTDDFQVTWKKLLIHAKLQDFVIIIALNLIYPGRIFPGQTG